MKKIIFMVIGTLTLVLGSTVAFAGDMSDPGTSGTQYGNSSAGQGGTNNPNPPPVRNVAIQNMAFVPANITIPAGTSVTWTNRDSLEHTVTGTTESGPMSGTLRPGQSYGFRFNQVGTFSYFCKIHPNMRGTVTVTGAAAPSNPSGPTDPPSTTQPPADNNMTSPASPNTTPNNSASANSSSTSSATNNIYAYYTGGGGTSGTQQAAANPTPAPTYTAPAAPAASTPAAAPADTTSTAPATLPNTGAGSVIALGTAATILGTGLGYTFLRWKASRSLAPEG